MSVVFEGNWLFLLFCFIWGINLKVWSINRVIQDSRSLILYRFKLFFGDVRTLGAQIKFVRFICIFSVRFIKWEGGGWEISNKNSTRRVLSHSGLCPFDLKGVYFVLFAVRFLFFTFLRVWSINRDIQDILTHLEIFFERLGG